MKSFREYILLKENEENDFVEILEKECSEIMSIYKNTNERLYHGSTIINSQNKNEIDSAEYGFKRIRTDRRPRDTKKYFHNFFNYMCEYMGFKTNRSNSVFSSLDIRSASFYGDNVYIIYPKNGFNFLWSSQIYDFTTQFNTLFDINFKKIFVNPDEIKNVLSDIKEPWLNSFIRFYYESPDPSNISQMKIHNYVQGKKLEEIINIPKFMEILKYTEDKSDFRKIFDLKDHTKNNEILISGEGFYYERK
jgi:hypothetical protein